MSKLLSDPASGGIYHMLCIMKYTTVYIKQKWYVMWYIPCYTQYGTTVYTMQYIMTYFILYIISYTIWYIPRNIQWHMSYVMIYTDGIYPGICYVVCTICCMLYSIYHILFNTYHGIYDWYIYWMVYMYLYTMVYTLAILSPFHSASTAFLSPAPPLCHASSPLERLKCPPSLAIFGQTIPTPLFNFCHCDLARPLAAPAHSATSRGWSLTRARPASVAFPNAGIQPGCHWLQPGCRSCGAGWDVRCPQYSKTSVAHVPYSLAEETPSSWRDVVACSTSMQPGGPQSACHMESWILNEWQPI
jgi:hypothetical protein